MKSRIAFTKKDLVVVLGCVVFLLMNLGVIGSGGRSRAKQAVCLSNLRQWGIIFSMYANDNGGYNPPGPYFAAGGPGIMWMSALRKYAGDSNDLYFCPMAATPGTDRSGRPTGARCPNKAWGVYKSDTGWGRRKGDVGSYGANEWSGGQGSSGGRWDNYWKTPNVVGAAEVPLFADSTYLDGAPRDSDPAPQWECQPRASGGINPSGEMNHFCISRHNGSINILFMDFSVRKVPLKCLWKLRWSRDFDTNLSEPNWTPWMQDFESCY